MNFIEDGHTVKLHVLWCFLLPLILVSDITVFENMTTCHCNPGCVDVAAFTLSGLKKLPSVGLWSNFIGSVSDHFIYLFILFIYEPRVWVGSDLGRLRAGTYFRTQEDP